MSYRCPICEIHPYAHSLVKLEETKDTVYFYTCPSQARHYDDVTGIIAHYDGVLSEFPEGKRWVWIFDSQGFGFIHSIQFTVARELAQLITKKFSKNIRKIIIINPTSYVRLTHSFVLPFLNDSVRELVEINHRVKVADELLLEY